MIEGKKGPDSDESSVVAIRDENDRFLTEAFVKFGRKLVYWSKT